MLSAIFTPTCCLLPAANVRKKYQRHRQCASAEKGKKKELQYHILMQTHRIRNNEKLLRCAKILNAVNFPSNMHIAVIFNAVGIFLF
jgi:hypothetical protein